MKKIKSKKITPKELWGKEVKSKCESNIIIEKGQNRNKEGDM